MALSLGTLVERLRRRAACSSTLMGSAAVRARRVRRTRPMLALSALALFVVGALYLGALSSFTTIAQLRVAAEIRGRVLAVYTVILGSLYPLGAVVQGKIADHIGLRATTFGAAALMARRAASRPGSCGPASPRAIDDAGRAPVGLASAAWQSSNSNGASTSRSLTLNRPEARNAISPEVSQTMAGLLDEIEADADAARGRADRRAARCSRPAPTSRSSRRAAATTSHAARAASPASSTRDFPKPIIAAVNGPALAGGFEIVLSCDLVVAADTARFGIPEVKRGLMAAAGGLIRLPKRVPLAIALELAMTGDPIDAPRALAARAREPRRARATRCVDEAIALAERIGENSPIAVRHSRQLVREAGRAAPRPRAGSARSS